MAALATLLAFYATPALADCDWGADPNGPIFHLPQGQSVGQLKPATITVPASCIGRLEVSLSDALPTGLSLDKDTGVITGTPTATPVGGSQAYATQYIARIVAFGEIRDQITLPLVLIVDRSLETAVNTSALTNNLLVLRQGVAVNAQPVTALYGSGTKRWSISAALPAGLSFDTATGKISGTPTTPTGAGASYTITVKDDIGTFAPVILTTSSKSVTIKVDPSLETVLAVPMVNIVTGNPLTPVIPVTASGGSGTITYALDGTLAAGMSFSTANGQLSGTPTSVYGDRTYTVTAKDGMGFTSAKSFTISARGVTAYVSTPSISLPSGDVISGQGYQPVVASQGINPSYTISPNLPAGLAFNSSNGRITGTPTARLAASSFTVRITDSGTSPASLATASFSLEVTPKEPVIFSVTPTGGNKAGGTQVTVSGANFGSKYADATTARILNFAMTNVVASSDGSTLSFTVPALPGVGGIQDLVIENQGAASNAKTRFTIRPGLEVVQLNLSPTLGVGQATSGLFPVKAYNGVGTISYVLSGTLPAGLSFNASTGEISGTPSAATPDGGTQVAITVTDQDTPPGNVESIVNFKVTSAVVASLDIPSVQLRMGSAASATKPVSATGGLNGYSYAISPSLPAGLSFNASTGTISGTPTSALASATYRITVTSNTQTSLAAYSDYKDFQLAVAGFSLTKNYTTLTYTSGAANSLSNSVVPVTVGGGGTAPIAYAISPALPTGLAFDTTTGAISGKPTQRIASTNFTITAADASSPAISGSATVAITVNAAAPTITSVTPSSGTYAGGTSVTVAGTNFGTNFANATSVTLGGTAVTNLVIAPTGDSLTFTTPAGAVGSKALVVTNQGAATPANAGFSYTGPPSITMTVAQSSYQFARNSAGSATPVTATGGTGALTWTASPSLPSGLSISASTGAISGTPASSSAAASYTITATDTLSVTASSTVTLSVGDVATITSPPVLTSMSPSIVSLTGGTRVTVTGQNLRYDTKFYFGAGDTSNSLFNYNTITNMVVSPDGTTASMTLSFPGGSGYAAGNNYTVYAQSQHLASNPIVASTFTFQVFSPAGTINSMSDTDLGIGTAVNISALSFSGGLGPKTYSVSPALPPGLSFNSATGAITGTPTTVSPATTYTFTVTDSDTPNRVVTRTAAISVFEPYKVTQTATSATWTVGVPITPIQLATVTGGGGLSAVTFSATFSGLLGLTLDTATGIVSGTPNVAYPSNLNGFIVNVPGKGNVSTANQSFDFTFEILGAMTTSKTSDVTGSIGSAISAVPVAAVNGYGTITYALTGTLPPGLSFDAATGRISGTASQPLALTSYTVTATDSSPTPVSSATNFDLTINAPAPTITGLSSHSGRGLGGATVVITGTGFKLYPSLGGSAQVGFRGSGFGTINAASFTIDSDTQITLVTAGVISGTLNAFVTLPQGTTTDSAAGQYTFDIGLADSITTTLTSSTATASGPFDVQIQFSEAVTGFDASDVSVSNGTVTSFFGSGTTYSATITPSFAPGASGNVQVDVFAGVANGITSGGGNLVSNSVQIGYRTSAVTLAISAPRTASNTAQTVTFQFSEAVTDFTASDVTLNTGTTLSNFTANGPSQYTAQIDRASDGVASLSIASGSVMDASGVALTTSGAFSFTVDRTPPVLTVSGPPASIIQGQSFQVTHSFSEDVTGFGASAINPSGPASVQSVIATQGSRTFVTTVAPSSSSSGVVELYYSLFNVTDAAGNAATLSFTPVTITNPYNPGSPSQSHTTPSYIVDAVAPYVSITRTSGSDPTSAPFDIAIAFTQQDLTNLGYPAPEADGVTGFSASKVQVTNGTLSNFYCSGQAPGSPPYPAAVSQCSATVTPSGGDPITVQVPSGAALDRGGNSSRASNVLSVRATIDTAQPVLSVTRPQALSNVGELVTFTFSKAVADFDASDITANAGTTVASFAQSDARTYTAFVTRSADGNATVNVAAGAAHDVNGLASTASTASFQVDASRPTVQLTLPAHPGAAPFDVSFTFSENVTGFAASDLVLGNATAANVTGSGMSYTATITPSASGAVTIGVSAGAASDGAGNGSLPLMPQAVAIDRDPPVATLAMVTPAATVNNSFDLRITFSKAVTGFDLSDLNVANGSLARLLCDTGDGASPASAGICTVTITPAGAGLVTVTLKANAVLDRAANANAAASFSIQSVGDPLTVTITGPTPTQRGAFQATFTFHEAVTGFDLSDITVTNGSASAFSGSGATYTATITPTATGPVSIDVAAAAAKSSATGQDSAAAQRLTILTDLDAPTVTITGPSTQQTGAFTATFTFNEAVTGFDLSDIAVTNGTASVLAGSGTTYTATISPSASGTITVSVPAAAATDAAGNPNVAATPFSVSAQVSILIAPTDVNASISLNVSSSEPDPSKINGTLSLRNSGTAAASFSAGVNVNWLTLDPTSGTITAGQTANIKVAANSRINDLAAGTYNAIITVNYGAAGVQGSQALSPRAASQSFQVPVAVVVAPRHGTITIVAAIASASLVGDTTFSYASAEPSLNGLHLATQSGRAATASFDLPVGSYDVTQDLPATWALSGIACTGDGDNGSTFDLTARRARIDLDGGETLVCTFTNSRDATYVQTETKRAIVAFMTQRARLLASNGPKLDGRLSNLGGLTSGNNGQFNLHGDGNRYNLAFGGSLARLWWKPGVTAAAKPGADQPLVDVWVQGSYAHATLNETKTNTRSQTDFGVFYVGADYGVAKDLRVGMLGQYDVSRQTGVSGQADGAGTGWMVGPYAAGRIADGLSFDIRAGWGIAHNWVRPIATYRDHFTSDRIVLEGHLAGQLSLSSDKSPGGTITTEWAVRPIASLFYYQETQHSYVNPLGMTIASNRVNLGQVDFGPELSWSARQAGGSGLEATLRLSGIAAFNQAEFVDSAGQLKTPLGAYSARLEAGLSVFNLSGLQVNGSANYDGLFAASRSYGLTLRMSKHF